MKKSIFALLILLILQNYPIFAGIGEGSYVHLSPGAKIYRSKGAKSSSSEGTFWGIGGLYKYQNPDKIYLSLSGSYYGGRIFYTTENDYFQKVRGNYYERRADLSLGYTFSFLDELWLVSPFACLGWFDDTRCLNDKETGDRLKVDYSSLIGYLGLDARYKINENLHSGIILKVGVMINPRFKWDGRIKDEKWYERHEVLNMKRTVCYEIMIPLKYYYDNFVLGLELSHAFKQYTGKDHEQKQNNRTFGLAVTFGWLFK